MSAMWTLPVYPPLSGVFGAPGDAVGLGVDGFGTAVGTAVDRIVLVGYEHAGRVGDVLPRVGSGLPTRVDRPGHRWAAAGVEVEAQRRGDGLGPQGGFGGGGLARPKIVKRRLFDIGQGVVVPAARLILVEPQVGIADPTAVPAVTGQEALRLLVQQATQRELL